MEGHDCATIIQVQGLLSDGIIHSYLFSTVCEINQSDDNVKPKQKKQKLDELHDKSGKWQTLPKVPVYNATCRGVGNTF